MIFKIHYGLWYGGLVGIIPFTFNYAVEYCGATATQHGILFTILPFLALLAKPLVCSYADKYAAHRKCLLIFIYLTIFGYGSLAIYPFFPSFYRDHQQYVWVLYCLGAALGNTSMCVVNSLGDSLAINSCSRKNIKYGQYRLWGPVGFGVFGAIWGLGNTASFLPAYTPGLLTMIAILTINSTIIMLWRDSDEFKITSDISPSTTESNLITPSEESQVAEAPQSDDSRIHRLRSLLKVPSVLTYMLIFTFCGILTGIHWQYFFEFLRRTSDNQHKNYSSLISLVLPFQSLGGELIFFFLASKIQEKLGASLTLVVCLLSFAARYLMYAYLIPNVDVYWILPVELLQGPAFGLMYCVLTHQANLFSERIDDQRSLHATLQGILGACFEGLGLGLGSLIGGSAFDVTATLMWQLAGYSALMAAIACAALGRKVL